MDQRLTEERSPPPFRPPPPPPQRERERVRHSCVDAFRRGQGNPEPEPVAEDIGRRRVDVVCFMNKINCVYVVHNMFFSTCKRHGESGWKEWGVQANETTMRFKGAHDDYVVRVPTTMAEYV